MYLERKEISERIKKLPRLQVHYIDWNQNSSYKPLELPQKVTNEQILKELQVIYDNHIKESSQKSTDNSPMYNQPTTPIDNTTDIKLNYFKTSVYNLNYDDSRTFFSPRFEEQLSKVLAGRQFSSLSELEVLELNTNLQNLSTVEYE